MMRHTWTRRVLLAMTAAVVAAGGALGFIYAGIYDVAATRQHTPPVYWALITSLRQSILSHAGREVGDTPDLAGREDRGLLLYERNCLACHGAPGVAMHDIGKGLTPPPANLVRTGREWAPHEIYWVVKHGLKMTGMPAWEYRLADDDLWSVVAFVRAMPHVSPADYRAWRDRIHAEAREESP